MIELNGKYASAKVYTDNVESAAISQMMTLLNQPFVEGSQIRIMPDTHAGAGCVIGTTMTLTDKVVPNLVGVDIGCGMSAIKLKEKRIDLPAFDAVIRKYIPSGGNVHDEEKDNRTSLIVENLRCYGKKASRIRPDLAYKSVGTLGGGNHFIELDRDKDDNIWLVIHTGSRHLGIEVCNFYQNEGYRVLKDKANGGSKQEKRDAFIAKLKAEGRHKDIDREVKRWEKEYTEKNPAIPYDLAYVEGQLFQDYIHDMDMVQKHAACNRAEIARVILKYAKLHEVERFETIHNYIDVENMILRKGSVSAQAGERLLIPINMRDGSLICVGKGNPDWNYSAPHGAGRLMSRSAAKESISMDDFKESMNGIYTTCVNQGTIDESPMAYKPMDEIVANIADTVDIVDIIKPIYNFKAGEE
jgi:RNA-splicing ligase RtcB